MHSLRTLYVASLVEFAASLVGCLNVDRGLSEKLYKPSYPLP